MTFLRPFSTFRACAHTEHGCRETTLPFGAVSSHLKDCDYRPIACPLCPQSPLSPQTGIGINDLAAHIEAAHVGRRGRAETWSKTVPAGKQLKLKGPFGLGKAVNLLVKLEPESTGAMPWEPDAGLPLPLAGGW